MVKNIQVEHQNKITALQKQLAKEEETNKELLEERVDRIAALEAENSEMKEAKKELEAKTEQLKAENTELKGEQAKHIIEKCAMEKTTKLVAELKSAVECPVCLVVPREGPVPCCPSGHITCSPCLERLRGEGRGGCPTCRVPMGEGKSLLAKVVIEHMEHQCSLQGCEEMVAFEGYREHQATCEHRLVVCPGASQCCKPWCPSAR